MIGSRVGWVTIYLLCVLAWPDSPEQMSSSLAYPASSSSHASCTGTSTLSQKRWVPDHWCNSSSTSSPWLSRVVEAWLNWFDGCPATVVEKGDKLMMDSPNAESIWPSLLLNTEKNVIRITISSNLPVSRISVCGRNPITLQFKWKLLFCGAANYSPVVLFIVLYKVVITFECVNEILWCDHSNEKLLRAVLSCGSVYRTVQGDSNFWVCGWKPVVWPFKHKLLSRPGYHLLYVFFEKWNSIFFQFCLLQFFTNISGCGCVLFL